MSEGAVPPPPATGGEAKAPDAAAAPRHPRFTRGRGGRGGLVTLAPSPEESEEWVISYMDMVTLLMIVFLGMVAILGIKGRLKMADQPADQPGQAATAVSRDADGAPAHDRDRDPNAASRSTVSPEGVQLPPDMPRAGVVPSSGGAPGQQQGPGTGAPAAGDAGTAVAGSGTWLNGDAQPTVMVPPRPTGAATRVDPNLQRLAAHLAAQNLPQDVELTLTAHDLSIEIKDHILFDSGSADIGSQGQAVLARLAPSFAQLPGMITVEGHTDSVPISTPRFPSNWELSAARAAAVVRLLIAHGVPPYHLRAVGYADTQPRDIVDKAANRRVTIQISQP